MARVCLIRDQALRGVCATGAQRRTAAGVGARRRQWRPEWSPDGRKLALTLGGSSGNPDIYILDLASQDLTRITDDPAIDTEPVWAPEGHSLYFTSDRAGSAQIYQIGAQPGARPSASPSAQLQRPPACIAGWLAAGDGNARQRRYRVAVQDLASGTVRVLSHGRLDESPSSRPMGLHLSMRNATASVGAGDGVDRRPHGLAPEGSQGEVRELRGTFSP